jgi:hypothetical protein
MSDELEQHLQRARREYLAQKYPGDLAADVLTPRAHRGGWWMGGVAGLAAAAAALIIVLRTPTPVEVPPTEPPSTEYVSLGAIPAMGAPELDDEVSFSFAAPSFTFAIDDESPTLSTTREAV